MGRAPCCDTGSVKKGAWSAEEDRKLKEYIHNYGTGGTWIALPAKAGLKRCGKSCRLRWLNYLRPNIKHGDFSDEEDRVICTLFATIGSRWSIIAAQLPGRTDNHVKNCWNTKLKKKLHHLLIAATHGCHYSSKPPAPPCFSLEHHHHTSPISAASSGQLLVFGAGGGHQQHSPCAVDSGAGLHYGISNNSSITNNNSGAVNLESLMLSGMQLQQEDTNNLLFPAAAATAENDIMTSGAVLLLDHHHQRQYQQYGGSGGGSSFEHQAMKPPLMISPDGFIYGDGEAAAAGAAATQQGTRFLY